MKTELFYKCIILLPLWIIHGPNTVFRW